jgi:ketosteroid isomerase-like protein
MLRCMREHPNVELARRAWDAISRGDAESLRETMSPGVRWLATARGTPWAGEHRGHEAVVDMLARVGEVSDFFQAELVDVLASDDRALFVFHAVFRLRGRVAELDYLLLGRVVDGRFSELWTAPLDPGAIEDLWSRRAPK